MRFTTTITELIFCATCDDVGAISYSLIDLMACDVWTMPMPIFAALQRGCRDREAKREEPVREADRIPLFNVRLVVDQYMPSDMICGVRRGQIAVLVKVDMTGGTDGRS